MSEQWWTGLAPVTVPIECGPNRHRLAWEQGRLTALDHPDAERERALVALGADPFPCLQLCDSWERHADDLDVLVLASRGPADPIAGPAPMPGLAPMPGHGSASGSFASMSGASYSARYAPMSAGPRATVGWTSYGPPHAHPRGHGWSPDGADREIERLLELGGGLPERFVATVIAAWAERIEADDERTADALPQLRAALYGRLVSTVRSWAGGTDVIDLELLAPGEPAHVSRAEDRVRVAVAFTWLRDVWAKGLATIFGQLCLSAESLGEDEWRLVTVAPAFGATRTMTIMSS